MSSDSVSWASRRFSSFSVACRRLSQAEPHGVGARTSWAVRASRPLASVTDSTSTARSSSSYSALQGTSKTTPRVDTVSVFFHSAPDQSGTVLPLRSG